MYANNFYDFWESEHSSVPREDALKLYLDAYIPMEAHAFLTNCIEMAEQTWEELKITAEMEECEKAIDIIHPPIVVLEEEEEDDEAYLNARAEEAEELEAIMCEGEEFFAELDAST
jgi:hypothetical protein